MYANRHQGFSLIELMVVLSLIGVLSLVGVFNFVTGLPQYRLKQAATDLVAKVRKAQSDAVKRSTSVSIVFDEGEQAYYVDGVRFPESGTLAGHYGYGVSYGTGGSDASDAVSFDSGDARLTFSLRGVSTSGNGSVCLVNKDGTVRRVRISAAGAARVEKWTGSEWCTH